MKANIFDIKHFAVHDGNGIRTTIFFKVCPLKCVWCHNPEGIASKKQIGYVKKRCINCGECSALCDANTFESGMHVFDRNKCTECGKCVDVCLGEAFQLHGKSMTLEEIFAEICEDKNFYENSNGGVTLSGGECLLQYDFCREILKMCKENGINTAVDTCGFVPKKAIDAVAPYTDIFLYDLKAFDSDVHVMCTGVPNKEIKDNLKYIDSLNIPVEIRIPFVPEYNENQMKKIGEFLKDISCITGIKLLAYHNLAGSKYDAIGYDNTMPKKIPNDEQMIKAADELACSGHKIYLN